MSPLLSPPDTREYITPLISRNRDIEIYHQKSDFDALNNFSGESIDIEMFDSVYTDSDELRKDKNHPGNKMFYLIVLPFNMFVFYCHQRQYLPKVYTKELICEKIL